MESVTLANGVEMPKLGYGVFQINPEDTARCVREAIEVGYRSIDTAQGYFNEEAVGDGVAQSGVDRGELFLTTKIWISNYGYEQTLASVDRSLKKMKTDYLDLVLIHQPFSDYYGAWHALEKLYKEGTLRAIGVSNFDNTRLADLAAFNEVAPMVNQVETNPINQQREAHEFMVAHNVQQEAWAPFGEGMNNMFSNPVLTQIGEAHGKSAAQVILRWLMQRDIVALPKSTHKERMEQNIDIFDFTLTDAEMAQIETLDTNTSLFVDHSAPEAVDMFKRMMAVFAGRE